jgi:DNA-binding transcriptional ArsR family regulator
MKATKQESVFRAVADPTRRAILDYLADSERSVSQIWAHLRMTQPAVSQHLRVLAEAGLVRRRQDGRLGIYSLEAAGLREVHDWSAHYQKFWVEKLRALGDHLDGKS